MGTAALCHARRAAIVTPLGLIRSLAALRFEPGADVRCLTNAPSTKLTHRAAMVAQFMFYNFRPHAQTLRMTLAMEAGVGQPRLVD
jgi:hypothetical protein